jgi:hypothetical protein
MNTPENGQQQADTNANDGKYTLDNVRFEEAAPQRKALQRMAAKGGDLNWSTQHMH